MFQRLYSENGTHVNRYRNNGQIIIPRMMKTPETPTADQVLWANISTLMQHHYKGENLNRLSRDAKIGAGTVARIKGGKQTARLATVDKIAGFFGLQAWQLLVPGLNPANLPVFAMTKTEQKLYTKLERLQEVLSAQ